MRLSRNVKKEMSNWIRNCGGLVIVSQGSWSTIAQVSTEIAVVGEREQRRTIVCVFRQKRRMLASTQTEEVEIHPCRAATGARILRRKKGNQGSRPKGLGYSVIGNGFHLRQWDSHRRAEVNAESLSECEHDQKLSDKPTVTCDSRIGRQAASKRCDATWRADYYRHVRSMCLP